MARDPLLTLARLRRLAVDEVRRALAARLEDEAEADRAVASLEELIARETETASHLSGDDAVVEAFGRWLVGARRQVAAARTTQERARVEVVRARAALAAARAGAAAVDEQIARDAAERAAQQARRDQQVLDDMSRRRKP
jgi:tRNA U55 pseudouridine synthase TruB